MPGFLLHDEAMITCMHSGLAKPTMPDPRVKLSGMPVAILPDPYAIAGCKLPPPPAANGPCVTLKWAMGATRVKANGIPVLLHDAQALCAPSGTGVIVGVTQARVKGM